MYVKELHLTNFRCFAKTIVHLNYPGRRASKNHPGPNATPNVNLFLGNNGSGKSSIFCGIALGILAHINAADSVPLNYMVRRLSEEWSDSASPNTLIRTNAEIEVVLQLDSVDDPALNSRGNSLSSKAVIQRIGDLESFASKPGQSEPNQGSSVAADLSGFFVAGYGASRRMERPEGISELSRSPRYQRVAGLFENHIGLISFESGNLELQSLGFLTEAHALLNQLLPPEVSLTTRIDSGKHPLFRHSGIYLPFSALSDGFRAYINWLWDLLLQLARVQTLQQSKAKSEKDRQEIRLTDVRGVVIVDEIDLFLHPLWQQYVVQKIASAFPNLQFLFSTHSPLVTGSLEAENLYVLDTDHNGDAMVAQYQEEVHGLSANQVLTGSYFGLASTRAPHAQQDDSLARKALSEDPEERADFVQRMLEGIAE